MVATTTTQLLENNTQLRAAHTLSKMNWGRRWHAQKLWRSWPPHQPSRHQIRSLRHCVGEIVLISLACNQICLRQLPMGFTIQCQHRKNCQQLKEKFDWNASEQIVRVFFYKRGMHYSSNFFSRKECSISVNIKSIQNWWQLTLHGKLLKIHIKLIYLSNFFHVQLQLIAPKQSTEETKRKDRYLL